MPASAMASEPLSPGAGRLQAPLRAWNAVDAAGTLSGMRTDVTSPDETRHRLLEGVLLRLARRPDAGAFVLRGGLLLRHWFRPLSRTADDLDLVAAFPF